MGIDDLIKLHSDLRDKTAYNDQRTRNRLQHALDDFSVWKEAEDREQRDIN